jgi:peptide/nickel transport system permease protein
LVAGSVAQEPSSERALRVAAAKFLDGLRRLAREDRTAFAAGIVLALIIASAVCAPLIAPYSPLAQDALHPSAGSSGAHLLGTDSLGRDILSRLLWGGRTSIVIGGVSVTLAMLAGMTTGIISGYFGGRVDAILMRGVDLILAFPLLILAILIVVVLGPNLRNIVLAISVSQFPQFARLARSLALSLRQREFVQAAVSIGSGDLRVMRRHVMPNILPLMVVQATTTIGLAILSASALSFLGVGIQPPSADWGRMVNELGDFVFTQPLKPFYPGAAIAITVLSANLLGDGLVKVFDPRGESQLTG